MPQYQLNGYDEDGELVFTADVPLAQATKVSRLMLHNPLMWPGSLAVTLEVARQAMPDHSPAGWVRPHGMRNADPP